VSVFSGSVFVLSGDVDMKVIMRVKADIVVF